MFYISGAVLGQNNRDLKKNSRGWWRQRRQNNKTNYTRQKAHVNMWNKADIRAVLLSCCSISTLSAKLGQYFNNYLQSFCSGKNAGGNWISAKIEINSVTKANTCYKKTTRIMSKYFHCFPTSPSSTVFLKFPNLFSGITLKNSGKHPTTSEGGGVNFRWHLKKLPCICATHMCL